ncbi:MAG: NTP pyrophosphohydrolase [Patescibacteria group bacterium]|nr:MAG: NTP pyrophosphohydrolase [Patescibacteria group bacterium]
MGSIPIGSTRIKMTKSKQTIIDELTQEVIAFRDERNWEQYQNPKDLALGLLIEAGELAEYFHYLQGSELRKYTKTFKKEIGEELSDVLYWMLLMAHDLDIDLVKEFRQKMQKNAKKYPPKDGVGKAFNRLAKKRAAAK